jgi:hypothetical protein
MDWINREAIENVLRPDMKRQDGLCLIQSWKPLIHSDERTQEASTMEGVIVPTCSSQDTAALGS